ncbi:chromosome partitioning protein, ParB family [Granulicella rosea]|uniref:Chromosome partitioning protein, ParB family n=1 Tax=Granulicella rosea TaxID=474952 RepID=A0A239HFU7_9BACT|nr:ParB/RepB/Spo0J family partition protein [Granulicella rosea]SNS80162.1 chromosome partitioning protein, ParB family [Granulicella rosea]
METAINQANSSHDIPLAMLVESPTNPRQHFDEKGLSEMAETIRKVGVYQAILVRPRAEKLEIVFGARRYRASALAGKDTIPGIIREMTDAEVLEAQLVENLQRRDVHPMEEAEGYKRLLALTEPTYTIEQIAAKVGKTPVYIATRLKLTELCDEVAAVFYSNEIGVGHAILLAKLTAELQVQGLTACFKEVYNQNSDKPVRILLPVRNLRFWIETNVLLLLKDAPFDKRNAQLVPAAGSCVDCPKRTGHNKLLFADLGKQDACTDPRCYQVKVEAHIAVTVAASPKLVQISTAYRATAEGGSVLPRNKYVAIREDQPKDKEQAKRPEFKTCKFTAEAIVAEGEGQGTMQKVCTNSDCPVHHPKAKQEPRNVADNAKWKAEQEKQRREQAVSETTGIRILAAIGSAVPVRLLKRDLLFVVERLAAMLDERRLSIVAKQHGIKKQNDKDSIAKLFSAFLRRSEESILGRIMVELTIVLAAARSNAPILLKEAAAVYKVDTEAITAKVKQEFAAKEKARTEKKPPVKAETAKKSGTAKKAA